MQKEAPSRSTDTTDAPGKSAATRPAAAVDAIAEYRIGNPDEFARNLLRLIEDGGKFVAALMERANPQSAQCTPAPDLTDTTKTLADLGQAWMSDPAKLAQAQGELYQGYMELWNNTMRRMMGEQVVPVARPDSGDARFRDAEWSANPYFDYWKQMYLLTTRWAAQMLDETPNLDERTRHKADFLIRQVSASLSPTNFPVTNPEVLRETFATNGRNLVEGMQQLLSDVEKSGPLLKISQTDTSAFEVGRNLAVTPGKVIFQNDLFQLIQYTPTTESVYAVPILIVPPWINKFYILDLTQQKSFIRYAVSQGFTVFVVSWVNPDGRLKDKTFEDYMREGVLSATDATMRETGQPKVNVVGYCVGGTLLASTLAYLAARGHDPYASATFLTTQVDFTKAGDLKLFIDEEQLQIIADTMAEKGYLEGSRMASVFNMLRPKDLIWPYVINNYMMGRKPLPFDLLYWNQDSTRMPAANHNFYLREFYHENNLATGPADASEHAPGREEGHNSDLRARRQGRPHRAGRVGVHRRQDVRRASRICNGRIRPYRRRHQSARPQADEVSVLDRDIEPRDLRRMGQERFGDAGFLVATLGEVAHPEIGGDGAGAGAGAAARRDRGCPRIVRQDQVLIARVRWPVPAAAAGGCLSRRTGPCRRRLAPGTRDGAAGIGRPRHRLPGVPHSNSAAQPAGSGCR